MTFPPPRICRIREIRREQSRRSQPSGMSLPWAVFRPAGDGTRDRGEKRDQHGVMFLLRASHDLPARATTRSRLGTTTIRLSYRG